MATSRPVRALPDGQPDLGLDVVTADVIDNDHEWESAERRVRAALIVEVDKDRESGEALGVGR